MRRRWKMSCYGVFAAVLIVSPIARPSSLSFKIAITSAHDTFKSGDEIKLQIAITNIADHAITISRAIDNTSAEVGGFGIDVQDDKGNAAPETRYQRALRGEDPTAQITWSSVLIPLPPGQTFKDAMIVNKFYDLRKGGTFRIQVQRTDLSSKIAVKSNVITVTVSAKSSEHPCQLEGGQRCEEILK
jgi:hypothetical protein